ncbi:MAG: hypothetical protein Q9206_006869 [Seirophora lacunosa]
MQRSLYFETNRSIKRPVRSGGPGFDVAGVALTRFLELHVKIGQSENPRATSNCVITCEGEGSQNIDLAPDRNLLTRVALYVLRCHDQHDFPPQTSVHIKNDIPLGRGLGSSGACVVAGLMLANEVGRLGLSKDRMLDYCLMIERHPDNVAAALYGGFVGTYLSDLDPEDMVRKEIPLSEVLPTPAGGIDTGLKPPIPPLGIGNHMRFPWSPTIKAIVIIPDFDAIHQPYRKELIPGLTEILQSVKPKTHPGLLGICLSGAGPTILALATDNFEHIAEEITKKFSEANVQCKWSLLEPANEGATKHISSRQMQQVDSLVAARRAKAALESRGAEAAAKSSEFHDPKAPESHNPNVMDPSSLSQPNLDLSKLTDADKRDLQQQVSNEMQKAKIQDCISPAPFLPSSLFLPKPQNPLPQSVKFPG